MFFRVFGPQKAHFFWRFLTPFFDVFLTFFWSIFNDFFWIFFNFFWFSRLYWFWVDFGHFPKNPKKGQKHPLSPSYAGGWSKIAIFGPFLAPLAGVVLDPLFGPHFWTFLDFFKFFEIFGFFVKIFLFFWRFFGHFFVDF